MRGSNTLQNKREWARILMEGVGVMAELWLEKEGQGKGLKIGKISNLHLVT